MPGPKAVDVMATLGMGKTVITKPGWTKPVSDRQILTRDMTSPITLTEQENRNLQESFITIAQDFQWRQYYEAVFPSILNKLEAQTATITFTEQESRAIQFLYQHFRNLARPWQPLMSGREMTFGQDTRQRDVIESILKKVEESF